MKIFGSKFMKKAFKFIVLILAFLYIVSPIDFLPLNPLDDIIVALIAFFIVFSDIGEDDSSALMQILSMKRR